MVDAMLKISIGGEEEDLSEMKRVLDIAQEKGLHTEAKNAKKELSRFKRIAKFPHPTYTDRSVAKVLQYALEAKRIVRKDD